MTEAGARLTNAIVLSKVTTSPIFMLASLGLASVSIAFRTIEGVHSFLDFEEAAARKLVIVQTGPGNLKILSTMLSACDFSPSSSTRIYLRNSF